MDHEWAVEELKKFIALTTLVYPPKSGGVIGDFRRTSGNGDEVVAAAQVAEKIIDRLVPRWRVEIEPDLKGRWQQHRQAAQRALVELERASELESKLGDAGPRLAASSFHPWVWDGARSLWSSGHRREAVRAAATKINAELQNKVRRRDISETQLVQECLSDELPSESKPRLRLPDDDGGKTAKSVRIGVMNFGAGCFGAIRNPISHDEGELAEGEALEQLAALSLLARWLDSATVEKV